MYIYISSFSLSLSHTHARTHTRSFSLRYVTVYLCMPSTWIDTEQKIVEHGDSKLLCTRITNGSRVESHRRPMSRARGPSRRSSAPNQKDGSYAQRRREKRRARPANGRGANHSTIRTSFFFFMYKLKGEERNYHRLVAGVFLSFFVFSLFTFLPSPRPPFSLPPFLPLHLVYLLVTYYILIISPRRSFRGVSFVSLFELELGLVCTHTIRNTHAHTHTRAKRTGTRHSTGLYAFTAYVYAYVRNNTKGWRAVPTRETATVLRISFFFFFLIQHR